jgi:TRAP transporter 4TM/12TM fusion protein
MIPEGIFGIPLALAAGYVSLFVLFSAMLQASGMGDFFQEVAMRLTGHKVGGPAKVAVMSSAMFGTISGSAAANVVGTGTFTIPLMKKCGYPGEFAGAVEATASTGGQLVPPVMGAAAFVMSEYIGTPYSYIMLAALIPAALYYLSVFISVDLRSRKLGLLGVPKDQLPDLKKVIKERGHLVIPFIVVIYMIIRQYTISYAALVGIILVIVFAQIRKTTRMSLKTIAMALIDGAKRSVSFGVSCACVGLIIGITTMTSVGIILGNYILDISDGRLFLTLFLVMLMSILLGMGMPTVAVYIVLATVAAPVLVKLGIPILAAHFFCFYFGILACVTPPVAVPAYAAAALAGANPGKTGWAAFKMALPTFLVPYVFVYAPSMLFINTNIPELIWVTFTCIMGVLMIAMGNEGYLFRNLPKWKAVLSICGGIACIVPEPVSDLIGVGIFIFIALTEYLAVKKQKTLSV